MPWLEGYALRCGYTMLEMSAYPLQWEWGEGGRYTQPWDRTPPAASASSSVPGAARGDPGAAWWVSASARRSVAPPPSTQGWDGQSWHQLVQ